MCFSGLSAENARAIRAFYVKLRASTTHRVFSVVLDCEEREAIRVLIDIGLLVQLYERSARHFGFLCHRWNGEGWDLESSHSEKKMLNSLCQHAEEAERNQQEFFWMKVLRQPFLHNERNTLRREFQALTT